MKKNIDNIEKIIKDFWLFIKYCLVGTLVTFLDIGALFVLVDISLYHPGSYGLIFYFCCHQQLYN